MTAGKRWLGVALGILLSAVFLYLALRKVDGNELRSALESARWWTTGPFLAVLFAYYWIKTVRWTYVLRGVAPGTSARLFPAVMVGYAAGALLPMQLGELVRAWLGADRLRIRLLASLASIALERVFDLLSIALLAALALTIGIRASPPWLLPAIYLLGAGALVSLGLFGAFVLRGEQLIAWAERVLGVLSPRRSEPVLEQLRAASAALDTLRSARAFSFVFAMSVLQWLLMFGCIWISLYAARIEAGALAAAVVTVFTVIGISLPNSPGYVGSIQLAFTLALEPFGVAPAQAVAASLFFHALAYVSVVLTGLSLLPLAGLSVQEIARRTSEARRSAALEGNAGIEPE